MPDLPASSSAVPTNPQPLYNRSVAVNRREFNRLGAAAVFALSAMKGRAGDFDYPWKLGIITDEVSPDLSRVLSSFYPKYHLGYAEVRNVQLDGKSRYVYSYATPAQLREIKKQFNDAGVKVS